jgi:hypothetical protein
LLLLLDTLGLLLAVLQLFSVKATTPAQAALVIIITRCHFVAGSCPEVVELNGFLRALSIE